MPMDEGYINEGVITGVFVGSEEQMLICCKYEIGGAYDHSVGDIGSCTFTKKEEAEAILKEMASGAYWNPSKA